MISGHVDVNDDGDFAIPETGIAGVTVTPVGTDNTGAPVSDATTTDEFGYYEFIGLAPGHRVRGDERPDPAGQPGIGGVTVTLTGTDDLGNEVLLETGTDPDGTYEFTSLRP
ncbi:MAG: hypothetical protein OEY23_17810, partial [Acidimicrobiia bacterium]|nr:hypothetical protein [Acidimicrobiia bacterium]